MARLYYTDPIIAAYMDKYHGVKFSSTDDMGIHSWDIELRMPGEKYYIAKESESIFDPKEEDQGVCNTEVGCSYYRYTEGIWLGHLLSELPEIIMRDDKHFFMCKVEK